MRRSIILLLALSILLCSCSSHDDFYEKVSTKSIFAMDTIIDVKLYGEVDDEIFVECENIARELEKELSMTISESDIARINSASNESVTVGQDAAYLIELAFDVNDKTDGAFDITLGPLKRLWNITSDDFVPPNAKDIKAALTHTGREKFKLEDRVVTKYDPDAGLDLGGIGKGYALEKTVDFLKENGAVGVVSYGGNIGIVGDKANGENWSIAVKDPFDTDEYYATLELDSGYVAVSGAYERYAEYDGIIYHHIIDPSSGYPSDSDLASVVVICDSGALADALSTALFVMGSERAIELYNSGVYDFEAIMIKENGEATVTDKIFDSVHFRTNKG